MKRAVFLPFLVIALGCGGAGGSDGGPSDCQDEIKGKGTLIDHDRWVVTDAGVAFFGEKPPELGCEGDEDDLLYIAESLGGEEVFSVYTDLCDWITVEQETLRKIKTGDTVKIRFWNFELTAPPNSEAHVGIAIGDELVWLETFLIPRQSGLTEFEWEATKDFPACAPILFHVDNHGNNEYSLITVERL